MTKIYIAGPMTGIPDYNRPAFNEYAAKLVAQGHTVLNPATLPDGLEDGEYMDICLAMVRACDELRALPGWEDSLGASVEYDYACKIGKTVTKVDSTLGFIRRHVTEWLEGAETVRIDKDGEIIFSGRTGGYLHSAVDSEFIFTPNLLGSPLVGYEYTREEWEMLR